MARFDDEAAPWTWRRWSADIELDAGTHELVARAWDDSAAPQPRYAREVWNPKGYANTSWARVRIDVR